MVILSVGLVVLFVPLFGSIWNLDIFQSRNSRIFLSAMSARAQSLTAAGGRENFLLKQGAQSGHPSASQLKLKIEN